METKEYRTADKSTWGPGPWQEEPDKVQWQDPATGLPCLIVRNSEVTGALCGYVGVPEGHPDYKQHYESVEVEVHGGLTFSDLCAGREHEDRGICHVPAPGEPDHVWWLGFDCSHIQDVSPAMDSRLRRLGHAPILGSNEFPITYKSLAYVKAEVTRLAAQLAQR